MPEKKYSKKELRHKYLALRDELPESIRLKSRIIVADELGREENFINAEHFLAFASYGSEIDTWGIIEKALESGKNVYLPRVEGEEMDFYRIKSLEDVQEGYRGIKEPRGLDKFCLENANPSQVFMLVPGACFNAKTGKRIGYGKGFYDKYLSSHLGLLTSCTMIGYDFQDIPEDIPVDEHDILIESTKLFKIL